MDIRMSTRLRRERDAALAEVTYLTDMIARLNGGFTTTSENNYRLREENEALRAQLAEAEKVVEEIVFLDKCSKYSHDNEWVRLNAIGLARAYLAELAALKRQRS
jgi:hypothetical protein